MGKPGNRHPERGTGILSIQRTNSHDSATRDRCAHRTDSDSDGDGNTLRHADKHPYPHDHAEPYTDKHAHSHSHADRNADPDGYAYPPPRGDVEPGGTGGPGRVYGQRALR